MSPWPSSVSAPFWSRITRESVCEETANAIRDGTLALIIPVITSTRGLWVASTRWMPTARAFWAMRMIESSTSAGRDHHEVGELVDHAQHVGQRGLVAAHAHLVEVVQRAGARERHVGVALLHLAHEVLQRGGGLARRGDDRREQVRDRVVVGELDLLGVDEDHAHVVRRRAQQDRREHRVDRARLAGAGRAGDEQVRHLRQVGADRAPGDVLAEPHGQRRPVGRGLLEDVAEVHDPPARVGHLDADRLLAGDRREDADVRGGQRVGEVVLELGDLGDLDPRREAQLVARDVRSGDHADDARLHAEVPERLEQLRGDALLAGGVGSRRLRRRALEEARARHRPGEVGGVGDLAPEAPLRGELVRIDVGARARDSGLVGLGVLGQARLGRLLRVGLRVRIRVGGLGPSGRRRGRGSARRPTRSPRACASSPRSRRRPSRPPTRRARRRRGGARSSSPSRRAADARCW